MRHQALDLSLEHVRVGAVELIDYLVVRIEEERRQASDLLLDEDLL